MDKHFETLDKKQGSLEHQDWTPQVVRKKKRQCNRWWI